jgi:carboxyl-terminal processing protease
MRALRTVIVVLLVALGFLGGYFIGWYLHGENVVGLPAVGGTGDAEQAGDLTQRVIEELQGRYYREVDPDKLSSASVDGLLKSLDDPYTVYLDPEEAAALAEKQRGEYSGIGASLQKKKGGLVITGVFDGSPAEQAGLKPGDVIITVGGKPTADRSIEESIADIKGEEGTTVKIEVQPEGGDDARTLTITRRRIEVPETRAALRRAGDTQIGYVQLFEFGGRAAAQVERDVRRLDKQGADAFILDLRYNGGGLLSQAVDVTGLFQTGVVTSTEGANSPREVLEAQGPVVTQEPLVVLVNQYSASASEIVTGALKDHDRATIMGTRTFGKGLVQSIVPLDDGAALKLTTAVYLTPDGTNINNRGISPDLRVKDDPKTKQDEVLRRALAYLAAQQ